ncbi:MAG TPA: GNAT family N-acetyltransferase [Gaiellales bacterium]
MSEVLIRPFQRRDREQVTELVNAHVGVALPGVSLSVNAVMSQLEREPGEIIVDPWVEERTTLVAVERERVVAAAHLLRYADHGRVGESYRNFGEIRWIVFGPGSAEAADALLAACGEQCDRWGVTRTGADMSLPAPCCYGVLDCWPHIKALLLRNGYAHEGQSEVILAADVAEIPRSGDAPIPGVALRRELGGSILAGTSFGAWLGDELAGFVLLSTDLTHGGTRSRLAGWGEIDTLRIEEPHRRRGLATWLLGHAAEWLRLGHGDRLIAYCLPEQDDVLGFAAVAGFRELARTERGWLRPARAAAR